VYVVVRLHLGRLGVVHVGMASASTLRALHLKPTRPLGCRILGGVDSIDPAWCSRSVFVVGGIVRRIWAVNVDLRAQDT
jgi:hypothetical protein